MTLNWHTGAVVLYECKYVDTYKEHQTALQNRKFNLFSLSSSDLEHINVSGMITDSCPHSDAQKKKNHCKNTFTKSLIIRCVN